MSSADEYPMVNEPTYMENVRLVQIGKTIDGTFIAFETIGALAETTAGAVDGWVRLWFEERYLGFEVVIVPVETVPQNYYNTSLHTTLAEARDTALAVIEGKDVELTEKENELSVKDAEILALQEADLFKEVELIKAEGETLYKIADGGEAPEEYNQLFLNLIELEKNRLRVIDAIEAGAKEVAEATYPLAKEITAIRDGEKVNITVVFERNLTVVT